MDHENTTQHEQIADVDATGNQPHIRHIAEGIKKGFCTL